MSIESGYYDNTSSIPLPTTPARREDEPFDSPTLLELRIGLRHLHYEISQLSELVKLPPDNDTPVGKALIEARLLHTRNLTDFFEKDERLRDSMLASDFDFSRPALEIDDYRKRLNKDLAHLTYSRTSRDAAAFRWPRERVYGPVLERSLDFVGDVLARPSIWGLEEELPAWRILETVINDALATLRG